MLMWLCGRNSGCSDLAGRDTQPHTLLGLLVQGAGQAPVGRGQVSSRSRVRGREDEALPSILGAWPGSPGPPSDLQHRRPRGPWGDLRTQALSGQRPGRWGL